MQTDISHPFNKAIMVKIQKDLGVSLSHTGQNHKPKVVMVVRVLFQHLGLFFSLQMSRCLCAEANNKREMLRRNKKKKKMKAKQKKKKKIGLRGSNKSLHYAASLA